MEARELIDEGSTRERSAPFFCLRSAIKSWISLLLSDVCWRLCCILENISKGDVEDVYLRRVKVDRGLSL
ncbi:hypothetical protein M413DRAFT_443431, partial [Hebeloma cylindrosporum]